MSRSNANFRKNMFSVHAYSFRLYLFKLNRATIISHSSRYIQYNHNFLGH
jgi:hypothetical protein